MAERLGEENLNLMLFGNPQEARKRRFYAKQFFQDSLLPKTRDGTIKNTDDVYDALAEYRNLHNTDIGIEHVFSPAHKSIIHAIEQCQAGKPILDFFEVDLAFSLLIDAITKDNRFFSDGIKPDRMVRETFRNAVRKLSRNIQLEKARLKITPD